MRTSQMLHQLKLLDPLPAILGADHARRDLSERPLGAAEIRVPNRLGDRIRQFHVGHVPTSAGPGAERVDAESVAGALDGFLRVLVRRDPALGLEGVGVRVEVLVVVDGVRVDADVGAGGQEVAVDFEAAGADFAPEGAADGGGHAEGFVDAGAEVAAGGDFGPGFDLVSRGEGGENFGDEGGVAFGVGGEVEEYGGEGGGGCVGPF